MFVIHNITKLILICSHTAAINSNSYYVTEVEDLSERFMVGESQGHSGSNDVLDHSPRFHVIKLAQ